MAKTVVLARTRDGGGDAFRHWLLADHATQVLAPLADRLVVQLATPAAGDAPPYDAVIELWSDAPLRDAIARDTDFAARALLDIHASQEFVAHDDRAAIAPGATPGISQLSFVAAIGGMSREEALRHWSEHVPLAREIHVGMNRYVQDRLSPGGSPWFGMAHLHFPDAAALRDGLFRTPADVEAVMNDVAEFVSRHAMMLADEHVIKA